MCFYWDVKIWYYLGQKTSFFFPLSEAIKFSWWSLGALSLREYTFKSKSFQSSQIVFERNVPRSVTSHAMLCLWQTHAGPDIVGKGYCTCFCVQCIGCDILFYFISIFLCSRFRICEKKARVCLPQTWPQTAKCCCFSALLASFLCRPQGLKDCYIIVSSEGLLSFQKEEERV